MVCQGVREGSRKWECFEVGSRNAEVGKKMKWERAGSGKGLEVGVRNAEVGKNWNSECFEVGVRNAEVGKNWKSECGKQY